MQMITQNQAKEIISKKTPKRIKIKGIYDYDGRYVFDFEDPEDEFTNMLAVNKKNGIVEQFNPYAEKDLGFFRKLYM